MSLFSCLVYTEGCWGEQASLEFDLAFGDVLLHKPFGEYGTMKADTLG